MKGFTLIELLAVIIILAIVALIATPIILDVIDEAQESANLSQVYLLVDGAEQLYANSFLDIDNNLQFSGTDNIDVYTDLITTGEKPEIGDLYIRENGDIYLKVIIDNNCYLKEYDTSEIVKCTIDTTPETDVPSTSVDLTTVSNISIFPDGKMWYSENEKIKVNTYGKEWKYCVSDVPCTPNLDGTGDQITLGTSPVIHSCVSLHEDGKVKINKCVNYIKDNVSPTITPKSEAITVVKGQAVASKTFFDVTFGTGSGEITCNHKYTNNLEVGNSIISCSATSTSGLVTTAQKEIEVLEYIPENETPKECFTFSGNSVTKYYSSKHEKCTSDIVIPSTTNDGTIVTSVSATAFHGSYNDIRLTSVLIPDTVTSIGDNAFAGNYLTFVILPNGLISLGKSSFQSNQIEEVILPTGPGFTTIQENAFNSNLLTELDIPPNITHIYDMAFSNNQIKSLVIPETVLSLARDSNSKNDAFELAGIENLEIKSKSIKIVTDGFAGNNITTLKIENAFLVARSAFSGSKLTNLTIGESTEKIEQGFAFSGYEIENLDLGNSITIIGEHAFSENKIKNLVINDSVVTIRNDAFSNNEIGNVIIPNSVTYIGKRAFSENNLESVKIPDSITSIYDYSFSQNPLKSVTIGKNVRGIGSAAFSGGSLKYIIIPINVNSIMSAIPAENVFFEGRTRPLNIEYYGGNNGWGSTTLICKDNVICYI